MGTVLTATKREGGRALKGSLFVAGPRTSAALEWNSRPFKVRALIPAAGHCRPGERRALHATDAAAVERRHGLTLIP